MNTVLAAAALLAASPALAGDIAVVGADEVHALTRRGALLVDTRSPAEFGQSHIVGAINIPAERTKAEAARLPRDRRSPVVFYCRGVG